MSRQVIANVTCVAIAGRGVLIEGAPGSGKSSLALALIDRGAVLVGDDAIELSSRGERLWAHPPPNIAGMLEIRGVGMAMLPTTEAPLCLGLQIGKAGDRVPEVKSRLLGGLSLPQLSLLRTDALKAEWALRLHGLPRPDEFV